MGGASAPMLSDQIAWQFNRAGANSVGAEAPPTKDFVGLDQTVSDPALLDATRPDRKGR
ncbi:DUF6053 domain-containing protein [Lysobacter capsici]|uniref:DUF6053 domain-containing protein n=1 Tax=Lysobacter capsici TaxID=435897 RepID=UPI003D2F6882